MPVLEGSGPEASEANPASPSAEGDPTYVVGIGASAGGLEALERVFRGVPEDSGLAFVIVQHLASEHRSMMPELASKWTTMPVRQAEDRVRLEPNCIYLLPPGKEMILSEGRLLLTDRERGQTLSLPIDRFFTSLARDCGRHAVAVVLSGTGSDGSRGIVSVREAGGLVLCQTRDSAEFDGMPRSAVDTGSVHAALPPERIGQVLKEFSECPDIDAIIEVASPDPSEGGLSRVFQLLRSAYGIDFADYKLSTVTRRTERRIVLGKAADLGEYLVRLEEDPEELSRLYHDLLIGVTEFFRDPPVWRDFEAAMSKLIAAKPEEDEIRVWSAGCAAGPEAYTAAIVIQECLRKLKRNSPVKVFATDVHRESLAAAGAGDYDSESLSKLPKGYRDRYFVATDGGRYRVRPELRRNVIFSAHSIVRDPPFTRLDAVTCRNVLIYFQTAAQQKAISLFLFGLRTGGLLLLGNSESPGDLMGELDPVVEKSRLFQKQRDLPLNRAARVPLASGHESTRAEAFSRRLALTVPRASRNRTDRLQGFYDTLLSQFIPPAFLIAADRHLMHKFGGAGSLLSEPDGRSSDDIFSRMPADLRATLTGGFQRALRDGKEVFFRGVLLDLNGKRAAHRVTFTPVTHAEETIHTAVLIRFDQETEVPTQPAEDEGRAFDSDADIGEGGKQEITRLREELHFTRENLQALVEELETSNEELQTTNEELIASNEEMQSTNEELNSVNEELYTLNAEYQAKIRELTELSEDVENLLRSTELHTVFLDDELRIRKFTPKAAEMYDFVDSDIGRKFESFQDRTDTEDLIGSLRRVSRTGESFQQEVRGPGGEPYLMRVLPYRGETGRTGGVVMTLIDVSAVRRAERRFHIAVEASGRATVLADPNGTIILANRVATEMFGAEEDALLGRRFTDLVDEAAARRFAAADAGSAAPVRHPDVMARRLDGTTFHASVALARSEEEEGRFTLATFADSTGKDRLRAQLRQKQHELHAVLENSRAAIYIKDVEGRYQMVNTFLEELNGVEPGAMLGRTDFELWPKEDAEQYRRHDLEIMRTGRPMEFEETVGSGSEMQSYVSLKFPVYDDSGEVIATGGVSTDITQQKRQTARAETAVNQRDAFLAVLSHELRNPLAAVAAGLKLLEQPDADHQREWVDGMVRRQVGQLAMLTDDLLDISRISRGRITLRNVWTDLRDVAEAAAGVCAERFESRQQTVTLETPDVPAPVLGDPARLEQVVVNLLTNASRYSDAGSETVVSVQPDGDDVVLIVRDNGKGLAEGKAEEIFEMFARGTESQGEADCGLGVGLALARQLVEQQGGHITAQSDGLGCGTSFVVRMPATDENRPPSEEPEAVDLPPKRFLVVDDNSDLATSMAEFLKSLGHSARVVNHSADACDAARKVRPEVILLDLGMPGMTGWEVAAELRTNRDFDRTVLIAISGYGQTFDRDRSREAGFDAHLTKPADHDELMRTIADCLRSRTGLGVDDTSERKPAADRRVLVIEDDPALQHLAKTLLQSLGATVAAVVDGRSALDAAADLDPEIVFCDLSLPGDMDGCEAGRIVAKQQLDLGREQPRLFALSGHCPEDWQERLDCAGFEGFISKPLGIDDLRAVFRPKSARETAKT